MYIKKIISCMLLSAIICGSFVSCGDKEESGSDSIVSGDTSSNSSDRTANNSKFDNSVAANSGDAYLAIVDSSWKIQYWGKNDDSESSMLSYDAGVAPITGNGDYTVSVTTDTPGYRFDTTGNENDSSIVPTGLMFMAVMIRDGETKFPNAIITVNEIRVDGKKVEMSAEAYTSSDDGIETRANLYNQWLSKPSKDGRSEAGLLYEDGQATDFCDDYSPTVVSVEDFKTWSKVEVDFTVSGI